MTTADKIKLNAARAMVADAKRAAILSTSNSVVLVNAFIVLADAVTKLIDVVEAKS